MQTSVQALPEHRVVTLLSGGMDSATLLYWLRAQDYQVTAISFDYGQRHQRELSYARTLAQETDSEHLIFDLTTPFANLTGQSALTNPDVKVPEGHYEDESMKKTVVPNRNMIMLSLAAAYAMNHQIGTIAYAAHSGDHAIYPDCRPQFVWAMRRALDVADWNSINLYTPFLQHPKGVIASIGLELGIHYDRQTFSCYQGGEAHCGKCGTCNERREAIDWATAHPVNSALLNSGYIVDKLRS